MMTSGEDQTHPRSHQPIMSIPAQPANAQASSSSQSQDAAHASVLMPSESIPDDATHIRGPNFDNAVNLQELLESYEKIGFQATGMAKAIKIVEQMVSRAHVVSTRANYRTEHLISLRPQRLARSNPDEPLRLFLGYTSNLISSGLREIICFLARHKLVDCIVTTAGGIEEDFIKCLGSTVLGDFAMEGAGLRKRGLNRIGNLLVPNSNYCAFEDWVIPILDKMVEEQSQADPEQDEDEEKKMVWTPSSVIRRLGKEIDNEESVYYWCYKVSLLPFLAISIHSVALTDTKDLA
jgi:deoxyhypusine synthase